MKNKTQLTKEDLQKQLADIKEREMKEMIKKHFPEFKKLEGKYFKTRNSYGGNYKNWWLYRKVVSVKPSGIYLSGGKEALCHIEQVNFQLCSDGQLSIQKEEGYAHSLGTQITEREFNVAIKKMKGHIEYLLDL